MTALSQGLGKEQQAAGPCWAGAKFRRAALPQRGGRRGGVWVQPGWCLFYAHARGWGAEDSAKLPSSLPVRVRHTGFENARGWAGGRNKGWLEPAPGGARPMRLTARAAFGRRHGGTAHPPPPDSRCRAPDRPPMASLACSCQRPSCGSRWEAHAGQGRPGQARMQRAFGWYVERSSGAVHAWCCPWRWPAGCTAGQATSPYRCSASCIACSNSSGDLGTRRASRIARSDCPGRGRRGGGRWG